MVNINILEFDELEIDFKHLFRIIRINLNKVTFRRYVIGTFDSLDNDKITVNLKDDIGEEVYEVTPEINLLLLGRVGDVIKKFDGKLEGKKKKKLVINKIIEI